MNLRCAFVLACLLTGCKNDDGIPASSIDAAVDEGSDTAAASCTPGHDCATACAADEVCAGSYGEFNRHAPACLKKCNLDTDCATGMRCADLYAEMLGSAVCISMTVPAVCGTLEPTWHCDFAPASCKDPTTLTQGFTQQANGTCGYEYVHCANACITDGDGGVGAHCD